MKVIRCGNCVEYADGTKQPGVIIAGTVQEVIEFMRQFRMYQEFDPKLIANNNEGQSHEN